MVLIVNLRRLFLIVLLTAFHFHKNLLMLYHLPFTFLSMAETLSHLFTTPISSTQHSDM